MNDAYRLGPVLDARDREARIRRGDLAAAVDGVRATAEHVAAAATRVTAARTALANARDAEPGTTARELAQTSRYLARLRRDLEVALDAHARAEASHRGRMSEADQARGRLARARADHEVIARHFERWREQARKLAERRAE